MALTYRSVKESPLTIEEIDSNFAYFTGSHGMTGSLGITGSLGLTGSLGITGSLSLTGSLTISGSIIPNVGVGQLTSSFDLGSATAAWKDIYVSQGSIKFLILSGSASSSVVLSATNNGLSINNGPTITSTGYSGSFSVTGSITSSGDIVFTTSSSGVVTPLNNITLSGTASFTGSTDILLGTNTTTYLQYGINLISSGSAASSSYCCRLPLVPKTGKEVTVINNSGCEVLIFPSMEDGDINGFVNGNIIIPPNNQAYTFVCYENPLPGGWSVTNLPNGATQIWDTSGIDAPAFNNAFSNTVYVNPTTKATTAIIHPAPFVTSLSAAQWGISTPTGATTAQAAGSYIIPSSTWKKVTNISVSTNITSSFKDQMILRLANYATLFCTLQNTTTVVPNPNGDANFQTFCNTVYANWANQNMITGSAIVNSPNIYLEVISTGLSAGNVVNTTVPGTFVPSPNETNLTNIIGGAGTGKHSLNIPNPNATGLPLGQMVGRSLVGTFTTVNNQVLDVYFGKNMGFGICCKEAISGGKPKIKARITTQAYQPTYQYN
jgi:hypothetical protein